MSWLPVPFGAASLLVLVSCLNDKVKDASSSRWRHLRRVDYGGNVVLTVATGALLYAVTCAGSAYPWSDARNIAALATGALGLCAFFLLEHHLENSSAVEPVMPPRLLAHR